MVTDARGLFGEAWGSLEISAATILVGPQTFFRNNIY
jgi:hypothetical protein